MMHGKMCRASIIRCSRLKDIISDCETLHGCSHAHDLLLCRVGVFINWEDPASSEKVSNDKVHFVKID